MFYVFLSSLPWATAYSQKAKFVRAKHSTTAEGGNCANGPTLLTAHSND